MSGALAHRSRGFRRTRERCASPYNLSVAEGGWCFPTAPGFTIFDVVAELCAENEHPLRQMSSGLFVRTTSIRSALGLLANAQPGLWSVAHFQLLSLRPSTRSNSLVFAVTSVAPRLRDWAAMSKSSGPMGVPFASKSARMSA